MEKLFIVAVNKSHDYKVPLDSIIRRIIEEYRKSYLPDFHKSFVENLLIGNGFRDADWRINETIVNQVMEKFFDENGQYQIEIMDYQKLLDEKSELEKKYKNIEYYAYEIENILKESGKISGDTTTIIQILDALNIIKKYCDKKEN